MIASYHYAKFCDGDKDTYYHNMYCAAIVHPDQKVVIPVMPEPIIKEDGILSISQGKRYIIPMTATHQAMEMKIF